MFKGVPFIMTANKLPSVMIEPKLRKGENEWDFRDRYNNYMAFMTRCKIHRMEKSHANRDQFPYNAKELAIYMDHIMDTLDSGAEIHNGLSDFTESVEDEPEIRQEVEERLWR